MSVSALISLCGDGGAKTSSTSSSKACDIEEFVFSSVPGFLFGTCCAFTKAALNADGIIVSKRRPSLLLLLPSNRGPVRIQLKRGVNPFRGSRAKTGHAARRHAAIRYMPASMMEKPTRRTDVTGYKNHVSTVNSMESKRARPDKTYL